MRRAVRLANCFVLISCIAASTAVTNALAFAGTVNIYSSRQPALIKPLMDAFTAETGIKTRTLFINKGLVERMKAEGRLSPADVVLTVDIGNLDAAKTAGVTQVLEDEAINKNIPAQYRDPEGHWFGVTTRSRVVYASKDRVSEDTLTYEELAGEKYKGRLCTRSGSHVYNIALFASLVAHHGEENATEIIQGLADNMARKPQGNDRAQAKGIFSGECDVALGNSYYVGLMLTNEKEPQQKDWAAAMKVIFPNNDGRGAHVNISGMALAKNAPNKDEALKLMAFLASDKAQEIYAASVHEYPVSGNAKASEIVQGFGEINPDPLPLAEIAKHRKTASRIVDRVGYNR